MIVIYHDNCYDGFTAAWVVKMKHLDAVLVPALYGKPIPAFTDDEIARQTVVMVDISWPRDEMEDFRDRLTQVASVLVVLDHHKTAEAALAGFDAYAVFFDMEKSGARLAWDYFNPLTPVNERPPLVDYVEDRDLWRFALPMSREVNAFIQTHERTIENWTLINATMLSYPKKVGEAGAVILARDNELVRQMVEHARFYWIEGPSDLPCDGFTDYKVPVVNASVLYSEVGHALLERYPEAPFVAYYFNRGDGVQQWGLRSRKDFDCSAVAKFHGGGGHPQAAGFQFDDVVTPAGAFPFDPVGV